jgi:S-adenosylmethionine hydrolase
MPLERLGEPLEPTGLRTLEAREPEVEFGKVRCEVIDYNRFGNIQLNVRKGDLAAARLEGTRELAVEAAAGSARAQLGETYADFAPGEYGVIFDPRGWLTIVRGNPGNALEDLGLSIGDLVWITGSVAEERP